MLSVNYAQRRRQSHNAECRYAEWRYAEWRGATHVTLFVHASVTKEKRFKTMKFGGSHLYYTFAPG